MVQYLSFKYQITHTQNSNNRLQISWSKLDAPSDPLFHGYKLLNLKEYNIFHSACVIYKVVFTFNKRLCELIPLYYPSHTYNTRKTTTTTFEGKDFKLWLAFYLRFTLLFLCATIRCIGVSVLMDG